MKNSIGFVCCVCLILIALLGSGLTIQAQDGADSRAPSWRGPQTSEPATWRQEQQTAAGDVYIVDDKDPGFSTQFVQDPWQVFSETGGQNYGDTHRYNHQIGTGQDTATWSFTVTRPGMYQVYAWWYEFSFRPADVPYTINHRDGSTTVKVDQRANGGQWNLLGTFGFQDHGSVVMSDKASSGQDIVADAIQVAYSSPLPDVYVVDDQDPGFSTTSIQDAWQVFSETGGQNYGDTHRYNHQIGAGQDTATWSFTVTRPGMYHVYAWWYEFGFRPTDVPYTIYHRNGSTTVRVSQRANGGRWNLLGIFGFQDHGSVVVSDNASSGQDIVADAILVAYSRSVFLPVAQRDYQFYFEGPCEVEPNNSGEYANGPLRSRRAYCGYSNDDGLPDYNRDYFSFYMERSGLVTVSMTNHPGTRPQLQLRYQVDDAGHRVGGCQVAPCEIEYNGQPGLYYIYVSAEPPYNSTTPYTLQVTFP